MSRETPTSLKDVYCVKCKKFTHNVGKMNYHSSKNGHKYIVVKCKVCRNNKSKFIS